MPITTNFTRGLDRKQWEMVSYPPVTPGAGSFVVSSCLFDQYIYLLTSTTTAFIYDPFEDGWIQLPSPALAGTFGTGSTGAFHPYGPRGFPTAGTTTTFTTNLTISRSLKNYKVRFIAGPNAGTEATIANNTIGANSVITLTSTLGTNLTTASEFILLTGRVWVVNGGTMASGSVRYYDVALNTWTTVSQTGLANLTADAMLVATCYLETPFATGTATSATSTTLVNSGKAWTTNQWSNYQVRITAGTGLGQFRTISSNTSTTLTVSAAWTTTPDATSVYAIEGNSDFLYLMGNGAVILYRYSIAANTWTTLSPSATRSGAPGAALTGQWIYSSTDSLWTIENTIQNGRWIYSFRGGGGAVLDRYDIALNTWESSLTYSPASTLPNTGTSYTTIDNYIYMGNQLGQFFKYDTAKNLLEPCSQLWYAQGSAILGNRLTDFKITDGGTTLNWLYFINNSQSMMFRMLVF